MMYHNKEVFTMKKETLYGGFPPSINGKTTFTVCKLPVLPEKYNVAVDCDYPQHSISAMRKRDAEQVNGDEI